MNKFFLKSVLSLALVGVVSCTADSESLDDAELSGSSESFATAPKSTSRVKPVNGGTYYIKNVGSQKFLDVEGNSTKNGANIHQWNFHGGNNQKWKMVNYDGKTRIQSVKSGKYMEIRNASNANGGNVQQFQHNNYGKAQKFKFQDAKDGRYYMVNIGSNKKVGVNWNSNSKGANVLQNSNTHNYNKWAFYKIK